MAAAAIESRLDMDSRCIHAVIIRTQSAVAVVSTSDAARNIACKQLLLRDLAAVLPLRCLIVRERKNERDPAAAERSAPPLHKRQCRRCGIVAAKIYLRGEEIHRA